MSFFEHCQPLENETFSSWLYRQGGYMKYSSLSRETCTDLFNSKGNDRLPDPDFDFESSFFHACCLKLGLPPRDVASRFSFYGSLLVPFSCRRYYCYNCFEEQIKQYGYPAYLFDWCSAYSALCIKHGGILSFADLESCNDIGRAQSCFLSHVRKRSGTNGYALKASLLEEISPISAISQEKFFSLDRRAYLYGSARDKIDLALCRCLLGIFLFPRYGVSSRVFYPKIISPTSGLDEWGCLQSGRLNARPNERAIALALLGWLLGFLDQSKAKDFNNMLSTDLGWHLGFDTAFGLGRCCRVLPLENMNGLITLVSCLREYSRSSGLIDEFLRGLKGGVGCPEDVI